MLVYLGKIKQNFATEVSKNLVYIFCRAK